MTYNLKTYAQLLFDLYVSGQLEENVLKRFLLILRKQKKLQALQTIVKIFNNLVNERQKMMDITIESNEPLPDNIKNDFKKIITQRFQTEKVNVREIINPLIIGGYKIIINDRFLIDATLNNFIHKLSPL